MHLHGDGESLTPFRSTGRKHMTATAGQLRPLGSRQKTLTLAPAVLPIFTTLEHAHDFETIPGLFPRTRETGRDNYLFLRNTSPVVILSTAKDLDSSPPPADQNDREVLAVDLWSIQY